MRRLNKVEVSVLHLHINLMASFRVDNLTRDHLSGALRKCKQKYPYLRVGITKETSESLAASLFKYVQLDSSHVDSNHNFKWNHVQDEQEFDAWQLRFNYFGSQNFDLSKSVFNIEFLTHLPSGRHQVYFSINHAGPFTFSLLHFHP
jgi:hypothetical protein